MNAFFLSSFPSRGEERLLLQNEVTNNKLFKSKTTKMKSLSLVIVDTINPQGACRAVETTWQTLCHIRSIEKVHWISNEAYPSSTAMPVEWTRIDPIQVMPQDYNQVVFELLPKIVSEDFSLTIQSDGYAVNPQAWSDAFLFYDYIGAVWPWEHHKVGNGGFSLRSQQLQRTILELGLKAGDLPEDFVICRELRKEFEDRGCVFAPPELADRFSIEWNMTSPWLGKSLGFHGDHEVKTHYKTS